jgi:hypothetical protein
MMNKTLLEQFLAEECTPEVRDLLRTELERAKSGAGPRRKRFEFNRFEVAFDIDNGDVLIEDILDVAEAGTQRIPLAEFSAAVNKKSG